MKWETLLNSTRARQSTSPGDHRAEFERDFDRAVFSTPVRRLQDKAQVFPLDPHDAVRTRLTHSLEVSTVARGLARGVAKWLLAEKLIGTGMDRSIEAIAATCGLIHDLGNPPFGHAGEDAIRYWFSDRIGVEDLERLIGDSPQAIQDFLKFEGNAQSLRLVAKLQILVDHHGLNFTFGTLSASCKYVAASHETRPDAENHAMSKPGYFASENQLIEDIRGATATGPARNPITFLVEAADDIVYSAADIEDGVKKGILPWGGVLKKLSDGRDASIEAAVETMYRILKAGESTLPPDVRDETYASAFRTASIGVLVPSVIQSFKDHYNDIMAGTYSGELVKDCDAAPLCSRLKAIGRSDVYTTSSTLKLELMGRKVVVDLMDTFWEGAKHLPLDQAPDPRSFAGKVGALLSHNYRQVFRHCATVRPVLPESYYRFQLVTDYVCGMTDSFAKRLHAELMNGA
jgi:dGTPase